jgi:hypothetical protein
MELSDSVLQHLREVVEQPDLSGTRYQLGPVIGRGGMGVVYEALDPTLNRTVAIKVFDAAMAAEAPLIARLEHPAIVPVYESGTLPDGRAWYAMKRIAGLRLDRHVESRPSLAERLRIFRRVGEAVGFAHSLGVFHRDIKPQNIMVGAFGEVYVMDWGVAGVAGTPPFRAPEPRLDERSDLYSLGALLRFLGGENAPPALGAIAEKAMGTDPEARYSDAAALLADIERFQEGDAVQAWQEPIWHRVRRFASRNAVLLLLLAAFVAVKAAFYFFHLLASQE